MAIGMKLTRSAEPLSPERSKFFGSPTMPLAWGGDFYDDTLFFCQINLEETAPFDKDGVLPREGFLYIFLDTEGGEYNLLPIVRYSDAPDAIFTDFNSEVPGFEKYTTDVAIEFFECDDFADGMKLLGYCNDWQYEGEPARLLMQVDHYDEELDFLSFHDGYTYITLGEDTEEFTDVSIMQEYS